MSLAEALARAQEGRIERAETRQLQKTIRQDKRQTERTKRVEAKAGGGYYQPESVAARQASVTAGLGAAAQIGAAIATGGASAAAGGLAEALAGAAGQLGTTAAPAPAPAPAPAESKSSSLLVPALLAGGALFLGRM